MILKNVWEPCGTKKVENHSSGAKTFNNFITCAMF